MYFSLHYLQGPILLFRTGQSQNVDANIRRLNDITIPLICQRIGLTARMIKKHQSISLL